MIFVQFWLWRRWTRMNEVVSPCARNARRQICHELFARRRIYGFSLLWKNFFLHPFYADITTANTPDIIKTVQSMESRAVLLEKMFAFKMQKLNVFSTQRIIIIIGVYSVRWFYYGHAKFEFAVGQWNSARILKEYDFVFLLVARQIQNRYCVRLSWFNMFAG